MCSSPQFKSFKKQPSLKSKGHNYRKAEVLNLEVYTFFKYELNLVIKMYFNTKSEFLA